MACFRDKSGVVLDTLFDRGVGVARCPTSRPKSRVIVLGSGYDLDGEGLIVMVEIDSLHLIES